MRRSLVVALAIVLCACSSEETSVDPGEQDSGGVDAADNDTSPVDSADAQSDEDTLTEDSAPAADSMVIDSDLVDSTTADSTVDSAADSSADSTVADSATVDSAPTDSASDAAVRAVLFPGFCPSTVTAPGLYRGNLASNTNDIPSAAGACGVVNAPGRDGALRVELDPGQTVRAVYRHAGDGVLYILNSCPVTSTCLAGADATSTGGEEVVQWKNTGSSRNPVYVILDSDALGGPQTFELDLFVTGP